MSVAITVTLIRESASLVRVITFGRSKVDIEEHLARHAESIDIVARQYAANYRISKKRNPDDFDEIKQAIMVLMWERHESPAYDHEKFTLWAYVQPAIPQVVFDTLNQYQHFNEGKDALGNKVELKVIAPSDVDEEGIPSLVGLEEDGKVTPINWYGEGYGEQTSSLSDEDQELAEKLRANLTDEELTILNASTGRSVHRAAEYLDMPYTTYYRKLREAKARAKALAASSSRLSSLLGK